MGAASNRASVFISHKVARHRRAAKRIQALLQSRTERLDVYVCEDIAAGDRWESWINDHLSAAQVLLVLWPRITPDVDVSWLTTEIERFTKACPTGRLVLLKAASEPVPELAKGFQVVDAEAPELTSRLLHPLFCEPSFLALDTPLNARIEADELARDANEIADAFNGRAETRSVRYSEHLVITPDDAGGVRVTAPNGCDKILNSSKRAFSWVEFRERAAVEKDRGTFWIAEIEQVMRDVAAGEVPRVMTSTFRGRGASAGQIFQPQLARVDFDDERPVRYWFSFHEVLVPELVRGPGPIGDVFNLLHIASRVRWEVLQPFLVNLVLKPGTRDVFEIPSEERDAIVAKVSGSLRVIELEALRHNMLQAAAVSAFEGAEAERVSEMLAERANIKAAILDAARRNDFTQLVGELTRELRLNTHATEVLAQKFVELAREDREQVARLVGAGSPETTMGTAAGPQRAEGAWYRSAGER